MCSGACMSVSPVLCMRAGRSGSKHLLDAHVGQTLITTAGFVFSVFHMRLDYMCKHKYSATTRHVYESHINSMQWVSPLSPPHRMASFLLSPYSGGLGERKVTDRQRVTRRVRGIKRQEKE